MSLTDLARGFEQAGKSFAFDRFRYVVAQTQRRGTRTRRVFKRIKRSETDLAHERKGVFEVVFRFAWKSDDDVRGKGQSRAAAPEPFGARDIVGAGVAPDHAPEHAVAAGLDGQMDVLCEHVELGMGSCKRSGGVTGVRARVPQARQTGTLRRLRSIKRHVARDSPKELRKLRFVVGVIARADVGVGAHRQRGVAVAVDRLAEKEDLAGSGLHQTLDFLEDLARGPISFGPARRRDDAEAASFVASFHRRYQCDDGSFAVASRTPCQKPRRSRIELGACGRRCTTPLFGEQRRKLR